MIGQLAAQFPDSLYNQIPRGLFNYGGGGVNAWRNICGVANGGAAMLKIVTNDGNTIDQYLTWFERTPFPSNAAYEAYDAGGWTLTGKQVPKDNAPSSVGKGLLCHSTHGRWLEAAGGADGAWVATQFAGNVGDAGSDRCAKLVYDCVYKVCELINAWAVGPVAAAKLDPSVGMCLTSGCHGGAGAYDQEIIDCAPHVSGKMKCDESCHM